MGSNVKKITIDTNEVAKMSLQEAFDDAMALQKITEPVEIIITNFQPTMIKNDNI
jgi:hypothetical protein